MTTDVDAILSERRAAFFRLPTVRTVPGGILHRDSVSTL